MATGSTPPLLGLPPEIRLLIFTYCLRSVRIRKESPRLSSHNAEKDPLAILLVCRQIYHEARPLVLPNVQLFCYRNAAVIDTLTKMSSTQVSQLRHMVVHHCPVGFNLSSMGLDLKEETTSVTSDLDNDDSYSYGEDTIELLNNEDISDEDMSDEDINDKDINDEDMSDEDIIELLNEEDVSDEDMNDEHINDEDINGEDINDEGIDDEDIIELLNDDEQEEDVPIIYFHLGAILGLFPGLQLDILEVFCGVGAGPYSGFQTTDCFGSLLEADGYRQFWMRANEGDGGAWISTPCTLEWKHCIATRFKPYNGRVQIKLDRYEWSEMVKPIPIARRSYYDDPFWQRAKEAGITFVKESDFPDDFDEEYDTEEDDEYEDGRSIYGHSSGDVAGIVVDRGDADFAVKKDDDRVLRCIERNETRKERSAFMKSASDALRKLFKENSWEAIQAMDGFDGGTNNLSRDGDYCYSRRI
ncbi:hypothetical protein GX51_06951 [Blastomyces parvus]|uniref:F-box domain-containing protein n=1 Tax=Blastomyces parvus TaxID=2060905 RepID=A0A2B7WND9_9EURO|nr:hypothetical protein GX51_06951 [Blastomyces parvus]